MQLPRFRPVADHALLVELADELSDDVNRAVIALDSAIADAGIDGVGEVIPAMVNLMVTFDPLETDHAAVERAIGSLFPIGQSASANAARHVVDVCYGDEFGPDLSAVAKACGMSSDAVINAHVSADYRVCMYGFAPGYAYLSGVPEIIRVPRKSAPVRDIRAGSILIAGPQCLATTLIMPTGWSIIGYTPTRILRSDPVRPFLFDVGDTVTFRRIGRDALPSNPADRT